MKPHIPKHDPRYRNIRPEELHKRTLYESEVEVIQNLKKNLNGTSTVAGWFAFFMGLAFQGISLYLVSIGQSSTKDVVGLAVGTLIFWLVGGLTLHNRIPKHASITHTQYGIVNGKWPSPARSGNTNGRTYYLDVIFPDTGTRIQKVICSYGDYKRAEQGQQVLAVVFEGKHGRNVYGSIFTRRKK